ncbi:MAG: putative DNA binding domain-containing protein [Planctomycetes bacterium]|nr:putative DNA binding domain-containing protein [Planctomycetota bacterium]
MTVDRPLEYLQGLLKELRALPKETEWIEFKENIYTPEEIGEYISALANAAVLCGKSYAYVIWGINDQTHEVVGTTFQPTETKIGNEELENWLLRLLKPKIHFYFYDLKVGQKSVVILEIERTSHHPVQFQGQEYIRVGSYKKKLKDFPEKERQLWRLFDQTPFEEQLAVDNVSSEDVLRLLDYPSYFDLLGLALPDNRDGILSRLSDERMIVQNPAGKWSITNLGAILFAKKLDDFKHLKRKSIRVIEYKGNNKVQSLREQEGNKGYASGYEGLIGYINNLLPTNEILGQALRKTVSMYPELAIRELVVNAFIHQDFTKTGTGPMIEIFQDRMEITNPGKPLVATERFLDSPPKSRNETLASFLRRIGVCEERGSGIDKVVSETEFYQLPAPVFEVTADHTRAVLFAHKPFTKMDKKERIRACYLHACLKYVSREFMTNSSIRNRFGIDPHNIAQASRIIRDAVDEGVVRPHDSEVSKKLMKYVPFWA